MPGTPISSLLKAMGTGKRLCCHNIQTPVNLITPATSDEQHMSMPGTPTNTDWIEKWPEKTPATSSVEQHMSMPGTPTDTDWIEKWPEKTPATSSVGYYVSNIYAIPDRQNGL